MINIGSTIKKFREKNKITQNQLAKAINVTPTYISALENNKKEPSISLLSKISKSLNIPIEVIFWDTIKLDKLNKKDAKIINIAKEIVDSYYKSE